MRLFLCTILFPWLPSGLTLVLHATHFAVADDTAIVQSWKEDYARIERELAQFRAGTLSNLAAIPMMDANALIDDSDRDAVDVQLRRLTALIDCLKRMAPQLELDDAQAELAELKQDSSRVPPGNTDATPRRYDLFMKTRRLAREVALRNPLLDFDAIIFNTFEHQIAKNNVMNHDQDVGYSAAPGGGIAVIEDLKTNEPTGRNLLDGVTIANGPYAGTEISTAKGSFNSFDLSFDGRTLVFAWTRRGKNPWKTWTPFKQEFWVEDNTFHLFIYHIGKRTCRQLTFGNRSDHSPCWLPNGRIAFMSERRNTTARCAASRHQPTSTMYSIKADGDDLIQLSWHDTEEWDPSVNNEGMIVYTRWDYLDRDFHTAHNFWMCYPDGRNPRSPHGNYPLPHTTLVGDRWEDGRAWRPWGEYNIRAIPNSDKYIAIAGGHHHTGMYGAPFILDIRIRDDDRTSQVKRITPGNRWINEACPPNTCHGPTLLPTGNKADNCDEFERYGYPWPLSEDFYLVAEGNGKYNRVYLLDKFGNREVLYSGFPIPNVSGLRVVGPRPFRPRKRPPVIPTATWQGERATLDTPMATISVQNVYESDFDWPKGTEITSLRIVQHVPRPWTSPVHDKPKLGYAASPTGRIVLGTVPVEKDGSAYFQAPIEKLIYFQALDAGGMAVQSMRSGTYVHPGEHLACVGCHEDKWHASGSSATSLAMQRSPSPIRPEVGGVEPINFHRLVRPVFEENCQPCHKQRHQKPDFSYASLEPYAFYFHADGGANHMSRLHGGSRTIAGMFGARWSRLYREGYLGPSHYDVHLTTNELRRITLWLDTNSLELPSFSLDPKVQRRARQGDLIWPVLDVDPQNALGYPTASVR